MRKMKISFNIDDGPMGNHHQEIKVRYTSRDDAIRRLSEMLDHFLLKDREDVINEKERVEQERLRTLEAAPRKIPPRPDFGPHLEEKVWEYDGAYCCTVCESTWGALPGRPEMPKECLPS